MCKGKDNKCPAVASWNEVVAFCKWLSDKSGMKVRLPSEVEWEYACRAGTQTRFYFGESEKQIGEYANIADKSYCSAQSSPLPNHCLEADDGYADLAPVGRFKPNKFGLNDMIGNVSEWCLDYYYDDAYQSIGPDKKTPAKGRVVRGGSCGSGIMFARCASRWYGQENEKHLDQPIGFRVVVEDPDRQ